MQKVGLCFSSKLKRMQCTQNLEKYASFPISIVQLQALQRVIETYGSSGVLVISSSLACVLLHTCFALSLFLSCLRAYFLIDHIRKHYRPIPLLILMSNIKCNAGLCCMASKLLKRTRNEHITQNYSKCNLRYCMQQTYIE